MKAWLGDVFILHHEADDVRYRLAGTRLCALYGEELGGTSFADRYEGADARAARAWIGTFGTDAVPLLLSADATTATGLRTSTETLVLPLANAAEPESPRALGITTADETATWIGLEPIVRQQLTSVRILRPWAETISARDWPIVRPAAVGGTERRGTEPGRRIAHLTVLEGGRT